MNYTLTANAKLQAKEKGKLLVKTSSCRQAGKIRQLSGYEWYGPLYWGSKSQLHLVDDTGPNRRMAENYATLYK